MIEVPKRGVPRGSTVPVARGEGDWGPEPDGSPRESRASEDRLATAPGTPSCFTPPRATGSARQAGARGLRV